MNRKDNLLNIFNSIQHKLDTILKKVLVLNYKNVY